MPLKKHDREYDVVVFGATGYTGKFTAEHIATSLPTDLKWAVAGRSREKLEQVVAQCREWNPDRRLPSIEVCPLTDDDLSALARKTFILITTVGPYSRYGETAFKACAAAGTHYLDVTGEVPWVSRMIARHSSTAAETGAIMISQIGLESAPSDLVTWSLASILRKSLTGTSMRDVVVSLRVKGAPSGGTLSTVLTLFENIPLREALASFKPFALSPVPNPHPASPPAPSLLSRLTGVLRVPILGLQTTSVADRTDGALVERTWGLLQTIPSRKDQAYGPNFSFKQYMRAKSFLSGLAVHLSLMIFGLIIVTPVLRSVVSKYVTPPGEGASFEEAQKDEIEYRGVAKPDVPGSKTRAFCRAWYKGPNYFLTGVLLGEAAATLLEDDVDLAGGIYTPACLGQGFIDRLDKNGFRFESKIIEDVPE
ncbi:Saccharopine dehydrogenase-domain-containing protein [Cercophora newfieldiana]|uniref:Saccharopine dehydrogenase-domain-containing protein n=1 Tax=Cercophora newfieldiana TaxID=92897 RepID=A0AA40CPH0_9PEZI|nr:Saccharopine dehydrogenase-domain-containing protein [Cercophora newfieldiana]